jgi:hypothetical protein
MNTKTPRDDGGRFQSWDSQVQTGFDSGRHQGRGEGALALAIVALAAIGVRFAYLKIKEKWF